MYSKTLQQSLPHLSHSLCPFSLSPLPQLPTPHCCPRQIYV
uniref:Uncharacterized protein n=1 Tax=Rhizophora mucronata TaxID=61149 RepID=A0A2P2QZH9_RHIMU